VPIVAVIAVALTVALPIDQRSLPPGWGPGLLLGVWAIIYACVPETDPIVNLVVIPVALGIVELWANRRVGWGWLYAMAGLIMLTGIYGATGRESALVGALFSWWPVIALACLDRYLPRLREPRVISLCLVIIALASAPAVVSRSGALEPTIDAALRQVAIAAPVSALATALLVAVLIRRDDQGAQRAG
jgi:hypothetical protein